MNQSSRRPLGRFSLFVIVMLVIEFLDEFAYSALEAARPLIRDDFVLTYTEISLITTIPLIVAIIVEPAIGLLFDTRQRRGLMVAGALIFGLGLIVQGVSPAFWLFVVGATLQAPASGIFVNLAQASLMDDAPARRENNMALWTFSGSLAVVVGPLFLTAALLLGSTWRVVFVVIGFLSILVALVIAWLPSSNLSKSAEEDDDEEGETTFRQNLALVGGLLSKRVVWRWLILLQVGDLMLDVLFGLLALYMVDVVGTTQTQAGVAIAVWTGIGLLGDFLLIPLLERVRGFAYLRVSALSILVLYPLFLLVEPYWAKLIFLGVIGLFNAGWYSIMQGKLYDVLGENSGTILIIGNVTGVTTALLPLGLGIVAQSFGLTTAMWLLLISPLTLALALFNPSIYRS